MPYEFMKVKGLPADHPGGGKHMVEFRDGDFLDYLYPLKERRGSSTNRMVIDTAGTKFIEYRFDCGHTTTGARGMYLRLYLTGAGGGGEALRAFCDVENVRGSSAFGAHISLKFGTTGSCSGLAVAMRATLHIPSQDIPAGGDYAPIQSEIWSDGAASDPVGATHLSYFRVVNDGHANGISDVDDDVYLFDINGHTINTGKLVEVAEDETEYAWNIKIRVGTQVMYLMCASART